MQRDSAESDRWTAADEAAWERREEQRHEYAEDLAEERRARLAHRCQCPGASEWPGSCPGPANCPCCDRGDEETTDGN
jgi:hypothetical protein